MPRSNADLYLVPINENDRVTLRRVGRVLDVTTDTACKEMNALLVLFTQWFSSHTFRKIDPNVGSSYAVIGQFDSFIPLGSVEIRQRFPEYEGLRDLLIQYADAYAALVSAGQKRKAGEYHTHLIFVCKAAVKERYRLERERVYTRAK